MKKVKITILKTMLNEDLAKEYGICGLKACTMMKVGDVFYADYAKLLGEGTHLRFIVDKERFMSKLE